MEGWIEIVTIDQYDNKTKSRTLVKKENVYHIQEVKYPNMMQPECEIVYSNGQYINTIRAYIDYDTLKNKLSL